MNKDCFNYRCPFRTNETTNANRCECIACPNRCSHDYIIIPSNRTLTDREICEIKAKLDPDYGVGRYS